MKQFSPAAVSGCEVAVRSSVTSCSRLTISSLCPEAEVDGAVTGSVDQAVLSLRLGQRPDHERRSQRYF